MRYKNKLLLSHSLLVLALIFVFVSMFHYYYMSEQQQRVQKNLQILCEKMLQRLDELIRPMEFVTDYILSDMDILNAINFLTQSDRSKLSNIPYIQEEKTKLQTALRTYASIKHFYRVNYLNPIGDFVTSNYLLPNVGYYDDRLIGLDWIDEVKSANGKAVVVPPAPDPWSIAEQPEVFSLVRMIKGNKNMGFIEVQQPIKILHELFSIPEDTGTNAIAVCKNGRLFYSNTASAEADTYCRLLISEAGPSVQRLKNPHGAGNIYVAYTISKNSGISLILIQNEEIFASQTYFVLLSSIGIVFAFLVLSMLYVFLMSRHLTRPVRELKQLMESTELDNLDKDLKIIPANDEFETLNQSYRRLLKRLDVAIVRQNKLSSLQIQASFDSLQAQVNPHFLYNVLNVISNRGFVSGDDKVCDICDNLAAMLRYSTGNTKRLSTVRDELEHLRHYLYLISMRYEEKLQFSINFDERLYEQSFPKIVLQQLAENSINHGYDKPVNVMQLVFDGWLEDNWMYIHIRDNGNGFSDAVLCQLNEKMTKVKQEIDSMEKNLQLEFGGLGLVNIYARFHLLYKDRFEIKLENASGGGAQIIIRKMME
jgi:two-component system sensor histidine kinase YesM